MTSLARGVPRSLALAAQLALLMAVAAPAGAKEKPVGKPVEHVGFFATFPTGLRLVVNELPGAPRASVGVSWLAGSMDDPPGKEGLAHLVEHLAFRCHVAGGSVWQRLQSDGVAFNAYTIHDATVYFEIGKPEQLRQLLSLEVQRMKDPLAGVTQAEFDTEREVVISEMRQRRQGFAEFSAREALAARLFGAGHPYSRSVGGSEQSIRSIAMADVKAYVEKLYRPERAIMTIVAGRPAKETAALAFNLLGSLATGPEGASTVVTSPTRRPKVAVPPDPPPDLLTLRGAVARPVLLVAFAVPGEAEEGRAMAGAAAKALSAVLESASWDHGDYEKVAGIHVRYSGHDGQGAIIARIELEKAGDPKKVLEVLRDNLFKAGNNDRGHRALVTERERDSQLMSTYLSLEHLDVGDIAEYVRATGKMDAIRGRQLQVVSLNQSIEEYWYQFLKRNRSAAVVVLPDPGNPELLLSSGGLAGRTNDAHSERDLPFVPGRPVEEVARPPGLDQALRTRLPNGLNVVMVRRPLLPLAEALLVIPTDLAGQGGTTTMLPDFAMSFAGTWSDFRWMHSNRLGARGYTAQSLESVSFMRQGTAETLPQLLEDLERLTHNFEFSRSQATINRDSTARALTARRELPSGVANDAFEDALYPGHPYGHAAQLADIEPLTSGDAERWIERQLRPDLATLIVVGDIEPGGALLKKITSTFGGWEAGRSAPPVRPVPPLPKAPRVILVDRPGAKMTELKVGFRAPPETMREGAAGDAVARRLGQTLQETLRVGAGVTYGVHALFFERPLGSALLLETAVDANVTGEALVRLLAGVEGLAQTPLPADATARVRWLLARDFSMEFDTISQVTSALATSAVRGFSPDHWEKQAASIASLTPARIQALARSLLGREIVMVIGDAKVVGPQLKDSGFDAELVAMPAKAEPSKPSAAKPTPAASPSGGPEGPFGG